jgi:hypothetical protein
MPLLSAALLPWLEGPNVVVLSLLGVAPGATELSEDITSLHFKILLVVYLFVIGLTWLNLLISLVSDTFQKNRDKSKQSSWYARARALVEIENLLRKKSATTKNREPRYLHRLDAIKSPTTSSAATTNEDGRNAAPEVQFLRAEVHELRRQLRALGPSGAQQGSGTLMSRKDFEALKKFLNRNKNKDSALLLKHGGRFVEAKMEETLRTLQRMQEDGPDNLLVWSGIRQLLVLCLGSVSDKPKRGCS